MVIDPSSLAILGGALALGGGLAGASVGIGKAGSAGVAVLSEDRGQLRNVIMLVSLPMTQAFYGLIIMILITSNVVDKLPATGGGGFAVLGLGIMAGLAEYFSAAWQGAVCASGISLLPKTRGKILTHSMMLAVFVELLGVLGMVFPIMLMSMLGLM
ncbi:MAG: hypothetical protein PHQ43_07370 [Dehalococcoidales bacterium]|nr:hypothetical protein [Dehalococcoidales bacterium]